MKYRSENEMCKDVTMLISGIIIPTKHKHIPEVPRSSGNNHSDMLFILDNGTMFTVEYKLNNLKSLYRQVEIYNNEFCIGIINQKIKPTKDNWVTHRIRPYTGEDWEIERINDLLFNKNGRYWFGGKHYKSDVFTIYWWGYKNEKSSLEGGIKNGKRLSFFELYKMAVKNIQAEYNYRLDFYAVHRILGYYEFATAKIHYNEAMEEIENATN